MIDFLTSSKIKSSKPAMQFNLCKFTLNLLLKGQWVTYCFIPFLFKLCLKLRQSFFVYLHGGYTNTVGSHLVSCSKDLDSLWMVSGTSLHYLLYNQGGPPVAANVLWLLLLFPVLEAVPCRVLWALAVHFQSEEPVWAFMVPLCLTEVRWGSAFKEE